MSLGLSQHQLESGMESWLEQIMEETGCHLTLGPELSKIRTQRLRVICHHQQIGSTRPGVTTQIRLIRVRGNISIMPHAD